MRKALGILIIAFYALLWIGGVVSYWLLDGPPADAGWTAPVFLLLASVLTLSTLTKRDAIRVLAAGIVGLLAEFIGVHTRFPFGEYTYTTTLQPHVFGVPLVMLCAWLVLIVYVREIVGALRLGKAAKLALGAVWMTAIDLVIDPLAAGPLDYWKWAHAGAYYGIPWTNFAGWLLVSFVALAVAGNTQGAIAGNTQTPNRGARTIGLSIVAFFALTALANGLYIPAAIGFLLCTLDLANTRMSSQ